MRLLALTLALFALAGCDAAEPQEEAPGGQKTVRITHVTDGDTIRVGEERIRLIGIDTPETRKPGVPVECGGKKATAFMTKLAFRKRDGRRVGHYVRLTTDPTQDRVDRYGRLLAYVTRRSDGADLGRAMIRAGWAMVYVYASEPFRRVDAYTASESQAQSGNRGVWASCGGDFHSEQ